MDDIAGKKLLWCLLCNEKYTLSDIEEGLYFSETGICRTCYKRLSKDEQTCFGKPNGNGRAGYEKDTQECGVFCPDKNVCKAFVEISVSKR